MKKKRGILKYTEPLILITFWMAIFAAPLFIFQDEGVIIWNDVIIALKGVIPFFLLFLLNHFLFVPFLLFRNKKVFYFIAAVILVIVFSVFQYQIEKSRPKDGPPHHENFQHPPPARINNTGPPPQPHKGPPEIHPQAHQRKANPFPFPPFVNSFIIAILIIGFDTGLRMLIRWSKLEQEKTFLEKENIQNQLAFLRNQVSPHFFMNTLNNIHALIDTDTEEAKETIIRLSKLMRHLLYDSQTELVPLAKELEFIKSYINLMKQRFSEKVRINLNIPDQIPDKSIPPLLFTSFVENAFKHGISYQNSSFIDIAFSFQPDYLTFEIKNSNPGYEKRKTTSGIGIENSRKRLNIIYGNKYSLIIKENKDSFVLILKIPV